MDDKESPAVSAASGFDPSHGPQRAHDLILRIGADSAEDLAAALRWMANDAERAGLSSHCCSGGPSVGYYYSYRHDPAQTHEQYFREIDEWLARDSDGSPKGGDGEAGSVRSTTARAEGIAPTPPPGTDHD